MPTLPLIHYEEASLEVKEIFDDIKKTRNIKDVNNYFKTLANYPKMLKKTWERVKVTMQAGHLTALEKEMIYIAVSATNHCPYCVHSHTHNAFQKGLTSEQYQELLEVIQLATENNGLVHALQPPIDTHFQK